MCARGSQLRGSQWPQRSRNELTRCVRVGASSCESPAPVAACPHGHDLAIFPAAARSRSPRGASTEISIELVCGCGPIAPSMSTVKSVAATRSMRSRTARIAALDPISGAAPSARPRAAAPTARDPTDHGRCACLAEDLRDVGTARSAAWVDHRRQGTLLEGLRR